LIQPTRIFDKDDKYKLSGRVVISRTSLKSTILTGYYDDDKKKHWKFELRKIEEGSLILWQRECKASFGLS